MERKQSSNPVETRNTQLSAYARVFEPKRTKVPRPYGIYPAAIPDTYVYERSVSSVSDVLSSDSSSTSSDSDLNNDSIFEFALEASSTRASSSTETLETTALEAPPSNYPISPASGPVRPSTSPPLPAQTPVGARLTRNSSHTSPSFPAATPRHATVEEAFDSDSETVISEGAGADGYANTQTRAVNPAGSSRGLGASLPLSTPIRRGSDEGSPRFTYPGPFYSRDTSYQSVASQNLTRPAGPSSPVYDESILRAPPGLQGTSSRPTPSRSSSGNSSKSQPTFDPARAGLFTSDPLCVPTSTNKRNVRWTEDLVCPSPILASTRRKGWYNRRG